MNIWKRTLSVGLSLALCAGMVAPAFAASFSDLQNVIDTGVSYVSDQGGISATDGADGTRNVEINEDVTYNPDKDSDIKSITVDDGQKVNLDLNGHTIDGAGKAGSVITVSGGAELTVDGADEDGNAGTIKGGTGNVPYNASYGGGINVNRGTLIAENVSITDNTATNGGGIYATDQSYVVLTDVDVSENVATGWGGGMFINSGSKLEMTGGSIDRNIAQENHGGGIYAKDQGNGTRPDDVHTTVVLKDVDVEYNTAGAYGGGINVWDGVHLTMTGGSLSHNVAGTAGAMFVNATVGDDTTKTNDVTQNIVTLQNVKVTENTAKYDAGGIYACKTGTNDPGSVLTLVGTAITNNASGRNVGGVAVTAGVTLILGEGNEICGNKSDAGETSTSGTGERGSDIYIQAGATVQGLNRSSKVPAGKQFDGWYQRNAADGTPNYDEKYDEETITFAKTRNLVAGMSDAPVADSTDPIITETYAVSEETEIDEPAVPLASGPVTRAEFLDYLWRHEGEPESDGVCTFTDVPEDHEYILALAWAEQNGVAEAYEDGTFEPDELVTVAAVREFLGNFAQVFGLDVDVYALSTLTGDEDEAVLNCDEVLAEFFGEELAEQAA